MSNAAIDIGTVSEHSGDPAAGIIVRRPILTEVGTERAMSLLRECLMDCRNSHSESPGGDVVPLPTRLLDLETDASTTIRLRNTMSESGAYCALIYCWGGEHQPTTTRVNLSARLVGFKSSNLPQTIRDAIRLTRNLGFRYLWVDALCIVQDDSTDKMHEINAMGSVYRGAALTISASSSSSVSDGFLHRRSEPMSFRLPFALSKDLDGTIGFVDNPTQHIETEALQLRGWSLQEHLLARRLVMFCAHEILFRCCYNLEPIQQSYINYSALGYLSLEEKLYDYTEHKRRMQENLWEGIVRNYSPRMFSDPHDRVNALVGKATELSKFWNDTYVIGFWRDCFTKQLAWYAYRDPRKPARNRTRSNNLPTWTWLSVNAHTNLLINDPQDAQLIHYGGRRMSALFTLADLDVDNENRAIQLRIRILPAPTLREEECGKEVYLDYSDSDTMPSNAMLGLLAAMGNRCYIALILRPLATDRTKMERIGIVKWWWDWVVVDAWDGVHHTVVTLV